MPFNAFVQEKILDFEQQGIPNVFPRDLRLSPIQEPQRRNLAQVMVGTRRCGKTYRLFQEMLDVLVAGYPASSLLYFNFEDERLKPYSTELLGDVLDTFFAMHPESRENGCSLFFDEIQEVPEWGLFLRRLIDTTKATVYVTGSSSRMLSAELGSEFRGRSISRELFPMGFSEYVRFTTGRSLTQAEGFSPTGQAILRNALNGYLIQGGYIAPLKLPTPDSIALLQEYAYRTVAMDVIERYNIRMPRVAMMFLSRCLASSARKLSVNKVVGEFKNRGVATSRGTLAGLLDYYEESYLLFSIDEFSRSIADNPRASSKVYAVDPGLFAAFSPASTIEEGQRLETAVFNKLRGVASIPRKGSIARLLIESDSSKHEVDFIVGDALFGEARQLVQISVNLESPKTRDREVRALEKAMGRFGLGESFIVTMDTQDHIEVGSGTINVVPAWKWLLDA